MHALIIGETGKVGGHVVMALRAAGAQAVVAARHVGTDGVVLDLRDAAAVESTARGFDVAFLTTPLGADETDVGLGALAALRRAGIGKIVYLGIMNLEPMQAIPHFATKIPIRDALLADGRSVMIGANFFFQNDRLVLPAILHGGVYPLPIGHAGIWSVDTGDIGTAAARALLLDNWNGQTVPLCGTEMLTGASIAATWSAALGRPVRYAGDAIDPFLAMIQQQIPGWSEWEANDFRLMMEMTQTMGCPATPADIAAAAAMIGRPQRRYSDFVAELVQEATAALTGEAA